MSDTNALDMFKSLFDNKLESNYLWSFKSGIQNKTIASTLEAVEVLIQYYIPNMGIPQKEVHTRIHAGKLLTLITGCTHIARTCASQFRNIMQALGLEGPHIDMFAHTLQLIGSVNFYGLPYDQTKPPFEMTIHEDYSHKHLQFVYCEHDK